MKKILIIFLLLVSTMQAQLLDVFGSKHNYSWIEQLADSNKFYTNTGDWTLHGSGSITRNADSSLTFESLDVDTYISLPYTPTQNQVHELSFDYEEGETNLIINGGFDEDASWDKGGSTTISEGRATINFGPGQYLSQTGLDDIDSGSTYQLKIDVVSNTLATEKRLVFDATGGLINTSLFIGQSTLLYEFICTNPTATIKLRPSSATTSGSIVLDNIRLYKINPESQSIESAKLIYSINNQTDSTEKVTSSYQTETKKFVGGSTDTLKISLSDTAKVKIKNPSIKLRVKQ